MDMSMSSSAAMPHASSTPSTSGSMGMGMGMGMGGDDACKISMTWNWYTVGACFISKTWRVRSAGMFAGSCIGVVLLVAALELVRRAQREFERRVGGPSVAHLAHSVDSTDSRGSGDAYHVDADKGGTVFGRYHALRRPEPSAGRRAGSSSSSSSGGWAGLVGRQLVRAALHTLSFGVAYFVMLLAMYYNGYIIICILIGAFLGSFAFGWDQLRERTSGDGEVTGCCG